MAAAPCLHPIILCGYNSNLITNYMLYILFTVGILRSNTRGNEIAYNGESDCITLRFNFEPSDLIRTNERSLKI
jgi:hypothetical protein